MGKSWSSLSLGNCSCSVSVKAELIGILTDIRHCSINTSTRVDGPLAGSPIICGMCVILLQSKIIVENVLLLQPSVVCSVGK